ncbi:allyl alcohol dehydrogenase-like protein [Trema orientale]|uniref:Allyl alcohol dehydrogenase-like protein n=1 Tax=Trema orientale TaxID=63057 RepID=A0A2P5BSP3_TREOI|nr:allyl alcohol dehydrogenase-like protein [Trema orientale]
MGILSWWKGNNNNQSQPDNNNNSNTPKPASPQNPKPDLKPAEVPGMNGAVEVPRPLNVTVFEFGSVAASSDKVTLAGYCPVSDELDPCRWEILPASGSDAPQFRVAF